MLTKQVGNKLDKVSVTIKNAEASASIPVGTPVMHTMSGTDDGLGVVLPSGSAAKAHAFAYGVALQTLAAGDVGYSQVFGFCNKAVILLQTRAASSDAWSASTQSLGVNLAIDTVNNCFSTTGGTQAKSGFLPFANLAEASTVTNTAASTTSDTRTVITGYMKVWLRMM